MSDNTTIPSTTVEHIEQEIIRHSPREYTVDDITTIGATVTNPTDYLSSELISHIRAVLNHIESVGPPHNHATRPDHTRKTRSVAISFRRDWRHEIQRRYFKPQNTDVESAELHKMVGLLNRITKSTSHKIRVEIGNIVFNNYDTPECDFKYSAEFVERHIEFCLTTAFKQWIMSGIYIIEIISDVLRMMPEFQNYIVEYINNYIGKFESGEEYIRFVNQNEDYDGFMVEKARNVYHVGVFSAIAEMMVKNILSWENVRPWINIMIGCVMREYDVIPVGDTKNPLQNAIGDMIQMLMSFMFGLGAYYVSVADVAGGFTEDDLANFNYLMGQIVELNQREQNIETRRLQSQTRFMLIDIIEGPSKMWKR